MDHSNCATSFKWGKYLLFQTILALIVACNSEEEQKISATEILTSTDWVQTNNGLTEIDQISFQENGDHLILVPRVVQVDPLILTQDTISGTYSLSEDLLELENQRIVLTPETINDSLVFVERSISFSCSWLIVKLEETGFEIVDQNEDPNFGCFTNLKNLTFEPKPNP